MIKLDVLLTHFEDKSSCNFPLVEEEFSTLRVFHLGFLIL